MTYSEMSFVPWLTSKMGLRRLKGRDLQESLDVLRALQLSKARVGHDISRIVDMSLSQQRIMLQDELLSQLILMFAAQAENRLDELQRRRNELQSAASVDPNSFPVAASPARHHNDTQILPILRNRLGFAVRGGPSGLPGESGNGAWLDGAARKGSVVGVVPGIVYLPGTLVRSQGALEALYPDDDFHLISRYDGTLIDSRGATPSPLSAGAERARAASHQRMRGLDPKRAPPSPFGVGHLCNHPPAAVPPNVMMISVDFPSGHFGSSAGSFPAELLELVPNLYDSAPSLLNGTYNPLVAMPSLALLATRDLKDEELFLDYRLSPNIERPPWYVPVDANEEIRRWTSA